MSDDRRRPAQYDARRDEALRRWVADEVRPFSPRWRSVLRSAGLGAGEPKTAADLRRVPLTELDDLGDGRDCVLVATAEAVHDHGSWSAKLRSATTGLGDRDKFQRELLDPIFKPIHWTIDGPLFVSSSDADLDRLAELGRRALAIAGLSARDRLLVVTPAGAGAGPWQLALGARDAGIATLHLDRVPDAATARAAGATAAAGVVDDLLAATDWLPGEVRTLVVLGPGHPTPEELSQLAAGDRRVTVWWAPTGARALWAGCGGEGLHTWPTTEVVEVVDTSADGFGDLVWSAVGWRGSVWLRLRTGQRGRLETGPCPHCRRTTPRVVPAPFIVDEVVVDEVVVDEGAVDEVAVDEVVDDEVAVDPFAALVGDASVADWERLLVADGADGREVLFLLPADRTLAASVRDRWHRELGCEVVLVGERRLAAVRAIATPDHPTDQRAVGEALRVR